MIGREGTGHSLRHLFFFVATERGSQSINENKTKSENIHFDRQKGVMCVYHWIPGGATDCNALASCEATTAHRFVVCKVSTQAGVEACADVNQLAT